MIGHENPLTIQSRVVGALMLRDMRTRFGGSYYGYLIAIIWPFVHLAVIAGVQVVLKRPAPVGESAMLFFATGLLPYITFLYISRNLTMSIRANLPLLYFPAVRVVDVIVSRTIVECATAAVVCLMVLFVLYASGADIVPQDPVMAFEGYLSAILLGLSFGVLNSAITLVFPQYIIVYFLFAIILYVASGLLFVAEFIPEKYRYYMLFNPLLHCVEWVRAGYYVGYARTTLSIPYLLSFCVITFALGMVLERLFRGQATSK